MVFVDLPTYYHSLRARESRLNNTNGLIRALECGVSSPCYYTISTTPCEATHRDDTPRASDEPADPQKRRHTPSSTTQRNQAGRQYHHIRHARTQNERASGLDECGITILLLRLVPHASEGLFLCYGAAPRTLMLCSCALRLDTAQGYDIQRCASMQSDLGLSISRASAYSFIHTMMDGRGVIISPPFFLTPDSSTLTPGVRPHQALREHQLRHRTL